MSVESLLAILGMAAVTYAIRAGGLLIATRLPSTGFIALWMRNIPGAVLGGLMIGAAETLVVGYGDYVGIPSTYRDAVAFAILILVLLIRPAGLLGSNVQEKV